MKVIALGLLVGVSWLQQLAVLPPSHFAWLLLACAPLIIWCRWLRFPLAVACGFLWALYQAHAALYPPLDPLLEGQDLAVTGVIASIPERGQPLTRFLFDIEAVHSIDAADLSVPERVRLSWYDQTPDLRLGQRWRLTVRLNRPRGFMNPGGFNYEGWLYSQGIRATGYVRDGAAAKMLVHRPAERPVGRLRQTIADAIAERLAGSANAGIVTALAIGERGDMDPDRWRLLLATGTNHLLAISGLNIGLVAGLVYFLTLYLWRLSGRLCLVLPAPRAASTSALVAGFGYALLAGFSIPTQRAVIMLAVIMGALILNRTIRAGQTLAVALLAVLAWDTVAVLSAGFWLSFAAVAIILYSMRGWHAPKPHWWQGSRLQWTLALGLAPLTLFFFQRTSLISPLANLVAVPWVGLFVGPLILIAVALLPVAQKLATSLLVISDWSLELLWWVLDVLAALPFAQWHHAPVTWTLIPAAVGIAWLLAPRGWPARWIGAVLLMPLTLVDIGRPVSGAYRMTLLDVGQGLAAVVETRHHTLVYDAGPRFSEFFNAGDAVVVPFLRHQGIDRIAAFVISHGDSDHSGGAFALLDALPVARLLTGASNEAIKERAEPCRAGQWWRWDDVEFEILYPSATSAGSANNRSCVLRIAGTAGAVLLTGDIEADAEASLLRDQSEKLPSDVLLVPHHGSDTSSTMAFIRAVNPELALVSAGYRNRYGLPTPRVLARYRKLRIPMTDTGTQGALSLDIDPVTGITLHEGYRRAKRRYWTSLP